MRIRKRASKRLGTKQREKVKKKVREHHRKSKREAKRDPTWRTKKRQDPGIPNSFPYKEQLLNEIEQRRMAAEQQRMADREARQNGTTAEAEKAADGEQQDADGMDLEAEQSTVKVTISAAAQPVDYTGSLASFMAESFDKAADPVVRLSVMLLDARDPMSWRVPQVEEALRSKKCPIVYGLTRADLVPREQLAAWSAHLSHAHPVYALCSPAPAKNGKPARDGGGIDALVAHIEKAVVSKASKSGAKAGVAIMGIENAGRTSLANILAASLPEIAILDTPALVPASSKLAHEQDVDEDGEDEDESDEAMEERDREAAHRVLIRNAGSIFKVREPMPMIEALMGRVAHESDLMMAHNTPAFTDTNDFLIGVARDVGRLKKGAVPDTLAAARTVLHQWSTGLLGYYAKPPPSQSTGDDKNRINIARQAIEADVSLCRIVLPRKEWRQKWQGKELRLTPGESGMLGSGKVAFTKIVDDDVDDQDDEEVEDELDIDEEDYEVDDDEDVEFEEDDDEEEEEEEDEDEDDEA